MPGAHTAAGDTIILRYPYCCAVFTGGVELYSCSFLLFLTL